MRYGGLAQPASFNGGMFGSLKEIGKKTSGQMDFICYFGGVGPGRISCEAELDPKL